MVEENEIRADLSYYERGRIALVAAEQGAFATPAAAVDGLFGSGSAAKRSKIKSFLKVHEALGDHLRFATALGERLGLRLAEALQRGARPTLIDALGRTPFADSAAEQAALVAALDAFDGARADEDDGPASIPPARRGRPRRAGGSIDLVVELGRGLRLERHRPAHGIELRVIGHGLDDDLVEATTAALRRALGDAGEGRKTPER